MKGLGIPGPAESVTNLVLAWNTVHMQIAMKAAEERGFATKNETMKHISPARLTHINFKGRFDFALSRYCDILIAGHRGKEAA